jgi:hypothetical protein
MVPILLPAAGVEAGGLQVAEGVETDPDVGVGGRYGKSADSIERVEVVDDVPIGSEVDPASTTALPANSRTGVGHIMKAGQAS